MLQVVHPQHLCVIALENTFPPLPGGALSERGFSLVHSGRVRILAILHVQLWYTTLPVRREETLF